MQIKESLFNNYEYPKLTKPKIIFKIPNSNIKLCLNKDIGKIAFQKTKNIFVTKYLNTEFFFINYVFQFKSF